MVSVWPQVHAARVWRNGSGWYSVSPHNGSPNQPYVCTEPSPYGSGSQHLGGLSPPSLENRLSWSALHSPLICSLPYDWPTQSQTAVFEYEAPKTAGENSFRLCCVNKVLGIVSVAFKFEIVRLRTPDKSPPFTP